MQRPNGTINCSVGILTYNSGAHLERCLKSVDDFKEIVIADGGSKDNTLEIAKKYNCKIISQSRLGQPIEDFAKERNRLLDSSSFDWFFSLDSDEIMSDELRDEIKMIANSPASDFLVYKVRYQIISRDLKTRYKSFKSYYQARFFNKKSGARFIKKMHERISFDETKFRVGTIESPWLVPLDEQLDFKAYREEVNYRTGIMVNDMKLNFINFLRIGLFKRLLEIVKYLIKIVYLRIRYNWNEIVPLRFEIYRIYSEFVLMKKVWRKYFLSRP